MTTIHEVPPDIIRLILFKYLEPRNVQKCLNTHKLFHVLHSFQLNIVKSCYLGWDYLISKGTFEACEHYAGLNVGLIDVTGTDLGVVNKFDTNTWNTFNVIRSTLGFPFETEHCYKYHFIFRKACENGNFELVKKLYQYSLDIENPINIHIYCDYAFIMSCMNGHLDIVKFLYNLDISSFDRFFMPTGNTYQCLLTQISVLGHLDVFKYLWNIQTAGPNVISNIVYYMIYNNHKNREIVNFALNLAKSNNIDISHTIASKYDIDLLKVYLQSGCILNWWQLFLVSSYPGSTMEIFEYLVSTNTAHFETNIEEIFISTCGISNLKLSQWIYQYAQDKHLKINMAKRKSQILRCCVYAFNVNVNVIEWILRVGKDINIHTYQEQAFRTACCINLDMAKWLYEYSIKLTQKKRRAPHDKIINIHILNDAAFKGAIRAHKIDICKWLLDLGCNKEIIKLEIQRILRSPRQTKELKYCKDLCDFVCEIHPEFRYILNN